MKISAHPLVVAAALGLLGPAALTEDDALDELAGTWAVDDLEAARLTDLDPAFDLGPTLEVIPVEDRILIDIPSQVSLSWSREGEAVARQELELDDAHITRSLEVDGDALRLVTVVERAGERHSHERTYSRVV